MLEEQKEESIYCFNNPYGFHLNINHPKINELYRRYKAWKGYPPHFPLSDKERREFESYILKNNPPLN